MLTSNSLLFITLWTGCCLVVRVIMEVSECCISGLCIHLPQPLTSKPTLISYKNKIFNKINKVFKRLWLKIAMLIEVLWPVEFENTEAFFMSPYRSSCMVRWLCSSFDVLFVLISRFWYLFSPFWHSLRLSLLNLSYLSWASPFLWQIYISWFLYTLRLTISL